MRGTLTAEERPDVGEEFGAEGEIMPVMQQCKLGRRTDDGEVRHRVARAASHVSVLVALLTAGCTYEQHVHVHASAETNAAVSTNAESTERVDYPFRDPLDAVVRVASVHGQCSGVVVADRLVVTSRTCLSRITKQGSFAIDRVRARLGGGVVAWHAAPAHAMLMSPCHGVAVLVTAEPIPSTWPLRMRLGEQVYVGEPLRIAGFGRCSKGSSGARTIGFAGIVHEVGTQSFALDASVCPGDAGGPLISEWTGEVVGVLDGPPLDRDDDEFNHSPAPTSSVAARVDIARGLLAQAFLVAHGVRPEDLPPISCQ